MVLVLLPYSLCMYQKQIKVETEAGRAAPHEGGGENTAGNIFEFV